MSAGLSTWTRTDGEPTGLLGLADAEEALGRLSSTAISASLGGPIRACYLDPPFNTGERFAHYSDSRTEASWTDWIAGIASAIAKLLAPDGSLWFHIGDDAQHIARGILDDVFGRRAFVATVIWQKRTTRDNRTAFSSMHDYIHVYSPAGSVNWTSVRNGLADTNPYVNPDNDPRGPWRSVPLTAQAGHATAAQFYEVVSPAGVVHVPPRGRCWAYSAARFQELVRDGRVHWPSAGRGKPRLKRFQTEAKGLAPFTIWTTAEVGDNAEAKKAVLAEFPHVEPFDTPKPLRLMRRILEIATRPGDVVIDPFVGSGTTLVAAEQLGRRWVAIEKSERTMESFVIPRLHRLGLTRAGDPAAAPVTGASQRDEGDSAVEFIPGPWVAA